MNRTKIEWVRNPDGTPGYTWNPITGCLNGCSYCYARRLANGRLKQRYLANTNWAREALPYYKHLEGLPEWNPFYPRFWPERLKELQPIGGVVCELVYPPKTPKGIFVCDMSDLFGIGIPEQWTQAVLDMIKKWPAHRFYLLTKQPQNLIKWSPFPDNCWVGVTATDTSMAWTASKHLSQIEAKVKFLSIEPLLSWKTSTPYTTENIVAGLNGSLDWLIIGAMTFKGGVIGTYPQLTPMPYGKRETLQPKLEWVEEIVKVADKAGIPVFLKNNLWPLFDGSKYAEPLWAFGKDSKLRQEMPGG